MNRFVSLALVGLGFSLAACSSFERDWRRGATAPKGDAFSGAWEGKWTSAKHRNASGRLRCLLTKVDERRYQARFRANWLVFTSGYTVMLETQQRAGILHFKGAHDLGAMFGGIYRYEGQATPSDFRAQYDSSYDTGTFAMSRRLTEAAAIP